MSVVLAVAQRGEGILTLKAATVANSEFNSDWLTALASAMQATMLARNGVGIAAPQVYVSKRVIIVAVIGCIFISSLLYHLLQFKHKK